ncbi:chaperonin 10-like protein [Penicillium hetheringtonii]|uniref:Chaperonin 10-like protein n=1 Tax=Penicillium hetheringtonii TaxID=911720 RepID=A0AAD6GQX4_9EURO|nr:chaperonin 10-like protein [Penicillium hetheringtonii]
METKTMQAMVYEGPFNIVVKEKPRPVLLEETDAILKVHIAGHQKTTTGHTIGHEFIGTVDSIGSAVSRFHPGHKVMSIFSPM